MREHEGRNLGGQRGPCVVDDAIESWHKNQNKEPDDSDPEVAAYLEGDWARELRRLDLLTEEDLEMP